MAQKHDAKNAIHHDVKILLDVKLELDNAARIQPCPACRHDMEQLGIFLESKIRSVQTSSPTDDKTARILKNLNYINELSSIGIFIARMSRPIVKLGFFAAPPAYKTVLDRNRKVHRIIREHLLFAGLMLTRLERTDEQYITVSNVLQSFLKATEFKLSADPSTFFIFDRLVRFCYRTHLLGFAGKAIVGAKSVVSCCIGQ